MMDERLSYRPEARSDFITDLSDAVRANPVPAVLIGAGVLWLLAGGRNALFGDAPRAVIGGVRYGAVGVAEGVHHAARGIGHAASAGTEAVSRGVSEAVSQGADVVRNVGESLSGAWNGSGGEPSFAPEPRHISSEVSQLSSEVSQRVQSTLSEILDRQPLLLGALGLAVGAGIAAAFPPTETESRLVGETSEAVKERGAELWDTSKRKAKDMASQALAGARAEGLTPAAAGEVAREVATRAAAVAQKTVDGVSARLAGGPVRRNDGPGINES